MKIKKLKRNKRFDRNKTLVVQLTGDNWINGFNCKARSYTRFRGDESESRFEHINPKEEFDRHWMFLHFIEDIETKEHRFIIG